MFATTSSLRLRVLPMISFGLGRIGFGEGDGLDGCRADRGDFLFVRLGPGAGRGIAQGGELDSPNSPSDRALKY